MRSNDCTGPLYANYVRIRSYLRSEPRLLRWNCCGCVYSELSKACLSRRTHSEPCMPSVCPGMAALTVGQPFDTGWFARTPFHPFWILTGVFMTTVKVRFQDPNTSARYSGTFNALTTIVSEERFSGLYKGIMSPMVWVSVSTLFCGTSVYQFMQATCALLNGLVFSSYRFLMKTQLSDDQAAPTLAQIFFAGAGTGMIGSYVVVVLRYLPILK